MCPPSKTPVCVWPENDVDRISVRNRRNGPAQSNALSRCRRVVGSLRTIEQRRAEAVANRVLEVGSLVIFGACGGECSPDPEPVQPQCAGAARDHEVSTAAHVSIEHGRPTIKTESPASDKRCAARAHDAVAEGERMSENEPYVDWRPLIRPIADRRTASRTGAHEQSRRGGAFAPRMAATSSGCRRSGLVRSGGRVPLNQNISPAVAG